MPTSTPAPSIPHAPRCQRRRAPLLRLSWRRTPEVWCPDCGRAARLDAPTDPTSNEENKPC